jgi:hypothetical protein
MKRYSSLSLIFFIIAIICFVIVYFIGKSSIDETLNQQTCNLSNENMSQNIGGDCRLFDGDTCLKGKFVKENGQLMCKHDGSLPGKILLYVSIGSIILSIIFLILNFTSKHKKK